MGAAKASRGDGSGMVAVSGISAPGGGLPQKQIGVGAVLIWELGSAWQQHGALQPEQQPAARTGVAAAMKRRATTMDREVFILAST